MGKFKSYDRQQSHLFPYRVEDYISEGHIARVIDEIVEGFDTSVIEENIVTWGSTAIIPNFY